MPAEPQIETDALGDELPEEGLPELVRLYIRQCLIGFAIGLAFTGMLVAIDAGHLQHLVFGTSGGWLAGLMLVMFNGLVFAGVQFAIRIMAMAEPETPPRGGLRARVTALPRRLIPVQSPARSRRR